MKKLFITFFIILSLFAYISCKHGPKISENKYVEQRDENGHLTQIDYYKNGSIYKTEYYEYLNSHHDESKLMKTVENGEVTYEMEECWKLAYCLEQNTYRYDGDLYYFYPNRHDTFGKINFNNNSIDYKDGLNRNFIYDIISQQYFGEYNGKLFL